MPSIKSKSAAAAAPSTKKVVFKLKKETPGAVQYEEVGADGEKLATGYLIGSLYLRKDKLGGTIPQAVKVTVEF